VDERHSSSAAINTEAVMMDGVGPRVAWGSAVQLDSIRRIRWYPRLGQTEHIEAVVTCYPEQREINITASPKY